MKLKIKKIKKVILEESIGDEYKLVPGLDG